MAQVITVAGEQLFATKAQTNQPLDIDTFIFAYVPGQDPQAEINRNEGLPPLAQRVHQQVVQQTGKINENVVVYSTVLDSLTGPFQFNWVGLYSSVNNVLVAVQHVAPVSKSVTIAGEAGNVLNRNFGIEYSGIADIAGITVSPETWQIDLSERLSGIDELTRKLAIDMNGRDWFINDGFKIVPGSVENQFTVSPGDGYVNGLRIEQAESQILTVNSYPTFIYIDAWFDGEVNASWRAQKVFTVSNAELSDYTEPNGKQHYLCKVATITASTSLQDHRGVGLAQKIENLPSVKHLRKIPKIKQTTVSFIEGFNFGGREYFYDPFCNKTGHNGGECIAPEALELWDGTHAGISTLLNWEGVGMGCFVTQANCLDFYMFGAVSGDVLSTDSIAACIKVMNLKKKPIKQVDGEFNASGLIRSNGWVDIDAIQSRINFSDGGFEFYNHDNERWVLTSYSNTFLSFAGRPDIEVAGVRGCKLYMQNAMHDIKMNDVVKILTEEIYNWINPAFTAKRGEFASVIHIQGNEIWLDRQLEPGYTHVIKLDKSRCKVHLNVSNNQEVTKDSIRLCVIRSFLDVDVKITALESLYTALYIAGCFNGSVALTAANFRNFDPNGNRFGYGIVDQNCEGIKFYVAARQIRHAYTTTYGGTSSGQHAYGEPRNSVISGFGFNCITPFDTHAPGNNLIFQNAFSYYSYGAGFSCRSANTQYVNCHTIGNGDTGFFIFNNEPAGVSMGRKGVTKLKNCSTKLHRRSLRTGYTNNASEKWNENFRFNVEIDNCDFENNIFSEAFLLQNTKLTMKTSKIVNTDPASSVLPVTANASNPVNLRSFFNLLNSEIYLTTVKLQVVDATNIVPFTIETDRTLNSNAITIVEADDLSLEGDEFNDFSEMVYSRKMHGQVSEFNYTQGLDYTFVNIERLKLRKKTIASVMLDQVAGFYEEKSIARIAGCIITAMTVIRNSPLLNGAGSFEGMSYQNPETDITPNFEVNLKNVYLPRLIVRLIPSNYGNPGKAKITVNSIINSAGRMAQGMIIEFINAATTGTSGFIEINAPQVSVPSEEIPAGGSYKLFYTGTEWRPYQ